MSESNDTPKVWASVGATIRTGDYENQKIDIGLSNVPVGASDEYIAELMGKATITLQKVIEVCAHEMSRIMLEDYGR